ncbi:MAG: aminopeptidase [Rikenellaceae bacterium]|nr:aminopeptidase [Rikenellaceae bacterium]
MSKKILLIVVATIMALGVAAQSKDGGISNDMLEQMRKSYTNSPEQRAIKNALASTPIPKLIINSENLAKIDKHFSHRVRTKGITNQKASGRCWLFTGLNILRAKMINKYRLGEMEFSQNYNSFYDQLEKSNNFLQKIIDTRNLPVNDGKVQRLFGSPIGDGGNFRGVVNLVMKYGVVPKEVMPETYQSEHTKAYRSVLTQKLRIFGLELRAAKSRKEAMALKEKQLAEVYRILTECMGVPPTEFEWTMRNRKGKVISTKKYTPKSFYEEYIAEDLKGNYVIFMNNPIYEYGKFYKRKGGSHVYDGESFEFLNLPMDRIKEMAIASIKDNTAMYLSCGVGFFKKRASLDLKNFDYESLFRTPLTQNKYDGVVSRAISSNHAMTLIAVDLDENGKPRKWMVENSWGPNNGFKGNLIMTDEWFDKYVFNVVIERQYIPEDILKMLKQKPTMLPLKKYRVNK